MYLLNAEEASLIHGGVIPVAAYAAFVAGAKWGAGITLATLIATLKSSTSEC